MKNVHFIGLVFLSLLLSAASCKKPKPVTETLPQLTLKFSPVFNGQLLNLRTQEYTKSDGEVIKLGNWSIILAKVSLIREDNSKFALGDGYLYIDFYGMRNTFSYKNIPEGNYKGISLQLGPDSIVNHGDPTVWAPEHPLNGNLTGMHWGWAGGYIFQVLDGTYKEHKDSTKTKTFSYHTVGDQFAKTFTMNLNFTLAKNENKTAKIELWWDEFFKNPVTIKIGDDANSHSGSASEKAWMRTMIDNADDVYRLIEVK